MDASKRLNSGFDSGRGMSLDYAGSGMDRGLPDFLIQLPVVSTRSDISLPSFYECVFTAIERFAGRRWLSFFVPVPHRLLASKFRKWIWKGTHGTSGVQQCSGQILARK